MNKTSNQSNLRFTRLDDGSAIVSELGDNWSVSFVDYNNDGYDDIFLPGYDVGSGNMLYRNTGTGFVRINFGPLVNETGSSVVSTWGDFDNDGDEDVFVASNVRSLNYLYRNDGNGTFTKVSAGNISEGDGYYHSASWVDIDNDGLLDLFTVDFMPTRFNKLYKNNGDGTFTELEGAGELTTSAARNIGATWTDFDMDGDEDVFIPNANGANNELYRNDGNGSFTRITTGPVVTDGGNSVGSSWGDIDNDGDFDLFVANASNEPNFLYKNNGDGTFTRVTDGPFDGDLGNSSGSVFGDIDNDGDLDLYVTNDQNEPKFLYINDGLGNFEKDSIGVETSAIGNTFGTALSDIDNDGDLDIFVATHSDEPNSLFINNLATTHNWVKLKLIGTNSNRSAIGATVRVLANIDGQAVWQTRHISGQSSGGAGGQSSLTVHFGLAEATLIDSLVIQWPSGYTQTQRATNINQLHILVEESGSRVAGTVFFDQNSNCTQDSLEAGIGGVLMEITPGPIYITTDNEGAYEAWLPEGTYNITPVNTSNWTQFCPLGGAAQSATITTSGQEFPNLDFGMLSLCNDPDLQVELGSTALRKGLRNSYVINFRNEGIQAAYQVSLVLELPNEVIPLNANIPWSQSASGNDKTTYSWLWDSIPALSGMTIYIEDSVSLSSTLGQLVTATLTATHNGTDCNATDNFRTEAGEIVGAVDPNDKLVFPKGIGPQGFISATDTLTYKIRFQNVGTFPAERVEIIDTLTEGLEVASLILGQMSHEGQVQISDQGVIRWVFDNIQLPDSLRDEPNSHGYVMFRIVPKTTLKGGTPLRNTAYIQFDYNPFIATNTVLNTLAQSRPSDHSEDNRLVIAPNPLAENGWIYPMNEIGDFSTIAGKSLELFSLDGRLIRSQNLDNASPWKIEREGLQAGLYLLKIKDKNGKTYHGKLMVK